MLKYVFLILLSGLAFAQTTTYTTNYSFNKPGDGDTNFGSLIRQNWDKADSQLKILENASTVWKKYTVNYSALSAAANTNTITIANLDAATVIEGIVVKSTVAFGGGTITDYTIDVEAGSTTLQAGVDMDAAPTDARDGVAVYKVASFSGIVALTVTANSVGDTLDNATAGSVDIYIKYTTLP